MLCETMSSRRGTSPRYPALWAAVFALASSESTAGAITDVAACALAIVFGTMSTPCKYSRAYPFAARYSISGRQSAEDRPWPWTNKTGARA